MKTVVPAVTSMCGAQSRRFPRALPLVSDNRPEDGRGGEPDQHVVSCLASGSPAVSSSQMMSIHRSVRLRMNTCIARSPATCLAHS